MRLIKQSTSSLFLFVASFSSLAFFQTFGSDYFAPATIMIGLLLGGFFGSFILEKFSGGKESLDDEVVEESAGSFPLMGLWALIALGAFTIYSFVIPQLQFQAGQVGVVTFFGIVKLPTTSFSTLVGAAVFGIILVPNAEEQFFRGLWGNFAVRFLPAGLAEIFAGLIFMVFHAVAYSLFFPTFNVSLGLILASAGATFVFVDLQTQNITTSIIAHAANNGLTFLAGGSIISYLFPNAKFGGIQPFMLFVVPTVALLMAYKRGTWRFRIWG